MQIGRVASTVRRGERQKQKLLKRDHDSQLGFKTNCILTLSMANEWLLQPDRHCEEHGNEGYFILLFLLFTDTLRKERLEKTAGHDEALLMVSDIF